MVRLKNLFPFSNRTSRVESWSSAINYSESPTDKLLTELAGQGITVRELADYLDQLMIETYPLGLRGFGKTC